MKKNLKSLVKKSGYRKNSTQRNFRNKNKRNTKNGRNRRRVNKSIKYGGMEPATNNTTFQLEIDDLERVVSNDGTLTIHIRYPDGVMDIMVSPQDNIRETIATALGKNPTFIKITFGGEVIEEDTFEENDIEDGGRLDVSYIPNVGEIVGDILPLRKITIEQLLETKFWSGEKDKIRRMVLNRFCFSSMKNIKEGGDLLQPENYQIYIDPTEENVRITYYIPGNSLKPQTTEDYIITIGIPSNSREFSIVLYTQHKQRLLRLPLPPTRIIYPEMVRLLSDSFERKFLIENGYITNINTFELD